MRKIFRQTAEQAQSWWSRRKPSTRTLPGYLWSAFQNFNRYGTSQAAALSYYAIFSIFPLTLLLAVAVNSVLGPAVGSEQIASGLSIFLPDRDTVLLLQQSVIEALEQRNSFTVVAVLGLLWSALGLFSNLSRSLDIIFQVPSSRSLWRQRLLAFVMIVILTILVGGSFITFGLLRLLTVFFLDRPSLWINIGTIFLPFSLNIVIFVLLFRFVPARKVHWESIWPAAIFGSAGWELAKVGFTWFLENLANFAVVYNSIATVIVLLLWAYVTSSVFLLSAELCARLNEWFLEHEPYHLVFPARLVGRSRSPEE
jgi:membrane protein